jgi:hypothetical protein
VEAVGGFDDAFHNLYEDQVFYCKICFQAPVFATNRCWGRYRQHPEASTQQVSQHGGDARARLAFLDWLEGYLRAEQIEEQEVWQALRRQKWLNAMPHLPGQAASTYGWVRWIKKWILRVERRLLPPSVRRWLWARNIGHG